MYQSVGCNWGSGFGKGRAGLRRFVLFNIFFCVSLKNVTMVELEKVLKKCIIYVLRFGASLRHQRESGKTLLLLFFFVFERSCKLAQWCVVGILTGRKISPSNVIDATKRQGRSAVVFLWEVNCHCRCLL